MPAHLKHIFSAAELEYFNEYDQVLRSYMRETGVSLASVRGASCLGRNLSVRPSVCPSSFPELRCPWASHELGRSIVSSVGKGQGAGSAPAHDD